MASNLSDLDPGQVLQDIHDPATQSLKTSPSTDFVGPEGTSLNVTVVGSLVPEMYDYISVAYPDAVTEEYTYKTGGVGGTQVALLTVTYTDASKDNVSSVART